MVQTNRRNLRSLSSQNPMILTKLKSVHLVLDRFIFTWRATVMYAKTAFKPRCCLYF
jgi:hypothetical protein